MFERVGIDRLVRAPVHAQVGLAVVVQVQAPQKHRPGHWFLEYAGAHHLALVGYRAGPANIDGYQFHRRAAV
jgi:hypothetical protein